MNSDTDSVKDETEPFKTQSVETNCIFIEKETRDSSGNINLQKTLFDIRDKAKKSEASVRKENMETASEEDRISKKLKKNKTKKLKKNRFPSATLESKKEEQDLGQDLNLSEKERKRSRQQK